MLEAALAASLAILSLAVLGALYRVLRGPSMPDRIIALDMIGVQLVSMVAVVSALLKTQAYTDLMLLIGIIGFLGTAAFSKYIEKGVAIEHDRDVDDNR